MTGLIQTFQMEKRLVNRSGTVIPVFLNASCVATNARLGTPLYPFRPQFRNISATGLADPYLWV